METDLIIKDERGTVRINVSLATFRSYERDIDGNRFRYDVRVWHKPPKKRTEIHTHSIATDAEILQAKMKLWELIKPS